MPACRKACRRTRASIAGAFANYAVLLGNRSFMRYTFCVTFFHVAAYAFITGSPKAYIDCYHIDPGYYDFWFGVNIPGVMTLSAANRRPVRHFPPGQLLRGATLIAAAAALLLAVLVFHGTGGIWGIALPAFLMFSMNGIIASYSQISKKP